MNITLYVVNNPVFTTKGPDHVGFQIIRNGCVDRLESIVQGVRVRDVHNGSVNEHGLVLVTTSDGFKLRYGDNIDGVVFLIDWGMRGDAMAMGLRDIELSISATDPLFGLAGLVASEADHHRCGAQSLMAGYGEALLVHLLRGALDHDALTTGVWAAMSDPRLARSLVAMHDAPEKPWKTEDLADVAGMSRSAFMDRFQSLMGEGPIQYLRRWRMQGAAADLNAGLRLSEVTRRCGYRSVDAFSRAYLRATGHRPTAHKG